MADSCASSEVEVHVVPVTESLLKIEETKEVEKVGFLKPLCDATPTATEAFVTVSIAETSQEFKVPQKIEATEKPKKSENEEEENGTNKKEKSSENQMNSKENQETSVDTQTDQPTTPRIGPSPKPLDPLSPFSLSTSENSNSSQNENAESKSKKNGKRKSRSVRHFLNRGPMQLVPPTPKKRKNEGNENLTTKEEENLETNSPNTSSEASLSSKDVEQEKETLERNSPTASSEASFSLKDVEQAKATVLDEHNKLVVV